MATHRDSIPADRCPDRSPPCACETAPVKSHVRPYRAAPCRSLSGEPILPSGSSLMATVRTFQVTAEGLRSVAGSCPWVRLLAGHDGATPCVEFRTVVRNHLQPSRIMKRLGYELLYDLTPVIAVLSHGCCSQPITCRDSFPVFDVSEPSN